MEITELNIISDFEAGMNCLQNPSLSYRFFSLSGVGRVPQVYSFWKWGALILAIVATFGGIISRIKLLFVRFCKNKLLDSSGRTTQQLDEEYDFDEDDSCSSASSDDEEDEPSTSFEDDRQPVDEDFCVAGSSFYRGERRCQSRDLRLRRRRSFCGDWFSWPEFPNGKSVVKLWDSLGLGFDFEDDSSRSVVSIWDLNRDRKISSFSGWTSQIPAVSMYSPSVILSAGSINNDDVLLGLYDSRVGRQIPTIYAEWRPLLGKVLGINSGGVEKVYVRDDVTGALTVGDMRNVKTPLENMTESNGDTWWDADAVIVSDEFVDDSR